MEVADEDKYDFDPLDASKIFPEDQFPLQPVGRMVLDRNIDNFFNEQEMVAFNPGVTPPGTPPPPAKTPFGRIDHLCSVDSLWPLWPLPLTL